MKSRRVRSALGKAAFISVGAFVSTQVSVEAQAVSKLKKILVLDKSQGGANGHLESRRDLNAALKELATEKGFTVTTIGQNDAASKISTEFSKENLATYQAVLFSNNDGVDKQIDATSKANLEDYVKNGGGLIPIHAASAFITSWPWLTTALVQSFYGPHGNNQPTANVSHDAEGLKDGTDTKGIFKGLTAPLAFLDEYYSFNSSPRGVSNVTILVTIDEKSFSKTVNGPMGNDHPVVWTKVIEKGRVLHNSMGHSWSTNNVYTAKNSYLKNFMYASLRYVAGDFTGCMDNTYREYNADATKSDATACINKVTSITANRSVAQGAVISQMQGSNSIRVSIPSAGAHQVEVVDIRGKIVDFRNGKGAVDYSIPTPKQSGFYVVKAKVDGKTYSQRITVM